MNRCGTTLHNQTNQSLGMLSQVLGPTLEKHRAEPGAWISEPVECSLDRWASRVPAYVLGALGSIHSTAGSRCGGCVRAE